MSPQNTTSSIFLLLKKLNHNKDVLLERKKEQDRLQKEVYRKILSSLVHGTSENHNVELDLKEPDNLVEVASLYSFPVNVN